jgi:putative oxidoreductase
MIDPSTAPYAALLLRLALGTLFLAHGLTKVLVFKPAGTVGYFQSLGLPPLFAYLSMMGEVGGGVALVLGIIPRYIALLLVPLMLGTIVVVHGKNGWMFTNKDGGWEYPAFWTAGLLVQFLLGDGAYALAPSPHWI